MVRGLTSGEEVLLTGSEEVDQELIGVINTNPFMDGESIEIKLSATDKAGNQNEVTGVVIKVDKSAKAVDNEIRITSPVAGEVISQVSKKGSYVRSGEEEEAAGHYYIDGIYQGNTENDSFDFDAIKYEENSIHSITVISQGESDQLHYSGGLFAYMLMSETFGSEQVDEVVTEMLESPKTILALRLNTTEKLPAGTSIEYFYSVGDTGVWDSIIPGTDVLLTQETKTVNLKAVLHGNGEKMPQLLGWQLEGILEFNTQKVVSRLLGDTKKIQVDKIDKVATTPFGIYPNPAIHDLEQRWLFADEELHQDNWEYDALSAGERTSHELTLLARDKYGAMYGSGQSGTELLLREHTADTNAVQETRVAKAESKKKLYSIRLLALTSTGEGSFFYSVDEQTWKSVELNKTVILEKASDQIYIKAELPADTSLEAWHLEGNYATGQKAFVQMLERPTNVMASDYGKETADLKYEISWQDPNGALKGPNYDTVYKIYRNDQYLSTTQETKYVDKDYKANAVYKIEIERTYLSPDDRHIHYLNRTSEQVTAQNTVIKAETKVIPTVKHDLKEAKQSQALDKLYDGNYTFSEDKAPPKDNAELNQRLLGKSDYCVAGFEPINFNTGNFFMETRDYKRNDLGDLALDILRTYNAQSTVKNGPFGSGWDFEYGQHLVFYSDAIGYRKADGALLTFRQGTDGSFTGDDTQGFTLSVNPEKTEYIIKLADGTEYHFTTGGLLKSIEKGGSTIKIKRDAKGLLTGITAPSGKMLKIESDKKGHITKITTPSEEELTYTYDGNKLIAFKDLKGNEIKYVYDEKGRMTEWYDGNGNRQVYNQYDEKSRVVYQEDAKKGKYKLEYYDDHTVTIDAEGKRCEVYFDEKMRTTKVIDGNGKEQLYSYNEAGYIEGKTDKIGQLTAYEYDADGNCIKETAPNGATILMTYDGERRLTSVTDQNGHVTSYKYDQNGNRTEQINPDGSIIRSEYNEKNQLLKETNELGYTTTHKYEDDLLVETIDPMGNKTS